MSVTRETVLHVLLNNMADALEVELRVCKVRHPKAGHHELCEALIAESRKVLEAAHLEPRSES